ncbi:MAG: hypothetical protein LBL75_04120 [Rickettsiales bacterium]|jgi:hypothetical protein|nr:hypothetical protein [Rickettsiales bacterium]
MNNKNFSFENMTISIALHLGIVALLITSFAVLNPMDSVVMSDHVQIYEIDLSRVEIKGDETMVFNTELPPDAPKPTQQKKEPMKKPDEKIGETEKPIESTTMVENKKTDKPVENKTAPRAPQIVRVNRETTSLNRTMTVSVVDALRVAMIRCWVFDSNFPGVSDVRAVAHLTMNKRGYVSDLWFEGESAAAENPAINYIFGTIRTAIENCVPFSMLPENEYDKWQKIQLTFYPASGKVN